MKRARANKGKRTNTVLLLVLLLILVVVAIMMVTLFVRRSSGITLEEPVHQYFMTSQTELDAGDRIDLGKDGVVFNQSEETKVGEDSPIYYENKTVFLLPRDYSWVDLNTGKEWFVPALSRVELDPEGNIWCVIEDKSVMLSGGFMTDSYHTFVFLAEAQVAVNGDVMTVSPLSFYSSADAMIRVLDYETDTMYDYMADAVQGDCVATMSGCSINLTSFVLTDRNGNPRMLVSSPSILSSLKDR